MSTTKIEWAEKSWNPMTGCTKVSVGCTNCYAERMAKRLQAMGQPRYRDGFKVTLHPEALDEPLGWKKSSRIFVCSMGDLFHPDVPDEFIDQVFAMMAYCHWHSFVVLTKRPARMTEWYATVHSRRPIVGHGVSTGCAPFCTGNDGHDHDPEVGYCGSPWPLPNLWLGVTCEDQPRADERWQYLRDTPAAVKFISYEPALGPLVLPDDFLALGSRAWLIAGGESGPNARPMHPVWARSVRDQCEAAGAKFNFKQWGAWLPVDHFRALPETQRWLNNEGQGKCITEAPGFTQIHQWPDGSHSMRVGKKQAGRLLDGKLHDEYPGR